MRNYDGPASLRQFAATSAKFAGIACIAVVVTMMLTRTSAGFAPKSIWFFSVFGLGLYSLGYFASLNAGRFGIVAMSLFVGGGAQLWLTQPLWFPALMLMPSSAANGLMVTLLVAQAGIAVWLLWSVYSKQALAHCLGSFGILRIVVFLALSVAFSVSLMGFVPKAAYNSYLVHLLAASGVIGINLLSVLALASLPSPVSRYRGFHPVLPAGLVFVASGLLAWFAFARMPHLQDEVVYLFQARTFAEGLVWFPAPPEAAWQGLEYYLLQVDQGKWLATTPPAWPALLALGVKVNIPWLVNPLLAALSVFLAHSVVRRLAGKNRADLMTLLLATSPWFLVTGASLMPHTSALFFILLSWWLLLCNPVKSRTFVALSVFAGLSMGWVFVTRQLEGVLMGTLTGLWLLGHFRQRFGVPRVIAYAAGCILMGSLYLIYNNVMTGNPLVAPLDTYISLQWQSGANSYGFGPNIGPPGGWDALDIAPGHSPGEAVLITLHNIFYTNFEFLGWGIGSLALVWCMALWGRFQAFDLMMLTVIVTIATALFFYWFSGSFYIGPRYWFSMLIPLLVLSAGGLEALNQKISQAGADPKSLGIAVFILCLFGLLVFTPWRGVEKYYSYGGFISDVRSDLLDGKFGTAIVFFDINADPGSALVLNQPSLPADQPIFIRDLGAAANAAVISAFPNRSVLYYRDGVVQQN